MQNELKTCPFCGGEATIQTFTAGGEKTPRYRIKCSDCWCQTDWDNYTVEDAIYTWNMRAGKEGNNADCD